MSTQGPPGRRRQQKGKNSTPQISPRTNKKKMFVTRPRTKQSTEKKERKLNSKDKQQVKRKKENAKNETQASERKKKVQHKALDEEEKN